MSEAWRAMIESCIDEDGIARIAQPLGIGNYAQAVEDESLVLLLVTLGLSGYQGYAASRAVRIA